MLMMLPLGKFFAKAHLADPMRQHRSGGGPSLAPPARWRGICSALQTECASSGQFCTSPLAAAVSWQGGESERPIAHAACIVAVGQRA